MKTMKFENLEKEYKVYILPLRNENHVPAGTDTQLGRGLYPTFKEWKQVWPQYLFGTM